MTSYSTISLCSKVTFKLTNLARWFRKRVLCNRIYVNKKQMKSLEKLITLPVSLKVAVGNVKYIFNIDILVNKESHWLQVSVTKLLGDQSDNIRMPN